MNEFEKHFEKLAKTDDASTLWINWLDWVIDQNLIINHDRKLNFKGNEKMYFQLYQDWIKIVSDEVFTECFLLNYSKTKRLLQKINSKKLYLNI